MRGPSSPSSENIHACKRLNFDWGVLKQQVDKVEPTIRIENIVVTFETLKFRCQCSASTVCKCGYDLQYLVENVPGVSYEPKKFSAVIHPISEPKSTALIFNSGKVVVTGTKSEKDAKIASLKHVKMLRESFPHMDIFFDNFMIQNVVGNGVTTFDISLEHFARNNQEECKYDPERFPGVTYRPKDLGVTMLIFVSGKMVIAGGKSVQAVRDAFRKQLPTLRQYEKTRSVKSQNLLKIQKMAGKQKIRSKSQKPSKILK